MAKALGVANYLLCLANEEEGEIISHLKLQKLLYYCQGVSLAIDKIPLFDEKIFAWDHGPVVREVYEEYRGNGSAPLCPAADFEIDSLSDREKEIIELTFTEFGQFSAWKLREMTHDEPPWKETARSSEIKIKKIQDFFETLTDGEDEEA